jgi:hypothetical protein
MVIFTAVEAFALEEPFCDVICLRLPRSAAISQRIFFATCHAQQESSLCLTTFPLTL